jgi:hypothetical protein
LFSVDIAHDGEEQRDPDRRRRHHQFGFTNATNRDDIDSIARGRNWLMREMESYHTQAEAITLSNYFINDFQLEL